MWKPMIEAALVREQVAAAIGPVTAWEAITEGENSQAYSAVAGGRELVVRVSLRREGFDLDAWAGGLRLGAGVAVPEVIAVGAIDRAWFCASTRLPGTRLCDLDMPAAVAAAPAVAEALQRISDTPLAGAEGFGGVDPATGNGRSPSWAGAVAWGVPDSWPALEGAERDLLEDLAASTLAETRTLPDFGRLVHGDCSADNLIVAEDGSIGVIDWEGAMIGDPLWDTAYQLFWSRAWPVMRPQARAATAAEFTEDDLQRLRCYMIVTGLRSASFYLTGARGPALDLMIDQLRAIPQAPQSIEELLPQAGLVAAPGELDPVEAAGGEVVAADDPFGPAAVAPRHARVGVVVHPDQEDRQVQRFRTGGAGEVRHLGGRRAGEVVLSAERVVPADAVVALVRGLRVVDLGGEDPAESFEVALRHAAEVRMVRPRSARLDHGHEVDPLA
ncbi:phosphotransferase [Glycomyces tritici]|uniref:Phosphotransferase n=1 Tax=Glycomyces tritici TaxID=2665176 RepID=A0ABT7YTV4_9ACTN|nr:phosphotransferase [Glycomyces tritici]MDN3242027.1 phosphotransferase [Glycomyces tritici]